MQNLPSLPGLLLTHRPELSSLVTVAVACHVTRITICHLQILFWSLSHIQVRPTFLQLSVCVIVLCLFVG